MKQLEKFFAIALLITTMGFLLWLYRAEPTVKVDPNDNAFQYGLVARTNQIWDYANRTCPKNISFIPCQLSLLTDHWVPNWAQGYNLPYYYSHVPQIVIVASWKLINWGMNILGHSSIELFSYYHASIYLLLCAFPLSMFLAFRILGFPWLTAGIAAALSPLISTDGLYGIDQTSFLWRGWGLSSQLFALLWFPLAIAYAIRYKNADTAKRKKVTLIAAIVFLTATTAGHLGIGMMAFLALLPIVCSDWIITLVEDWGIFRGWKQKLREQFQTSVKQIFLLAIPPIIILSYWIVPAFLNNNYHNISLWDPIWKFQSFGVNQVITMLINGQLFDFGRIPIFTALVFIGLFTSLIVIPDKRSSQLFEKRSAIRDPSHNLQILKQVQDDKKIFAWIFLFFLTLFFGSSTWGSLINLIPGMKEFHQHRFIVGLHMAGLFLAPIGTTWIMEQISHLAGTITKKFIRQTYIIHALVYSCIGLFVCISLIPHIIDYASYNTTLIRQANESYAQQASDITLLTSTLSELIAAKPGRVYALRGNEGKNFRIADAAYYLTLSARGIPTTLWLPETWSMNSDTEQFFSEDNPSHYDLYTIRYVVAPPDKKPQPFWRVIQETPNWKLYEVASEQYVTTGTAPSSVYAKKTDLINLIHLWIQSDYPKQHIFPQFTSHPSKLIRSVPHFSMIDPATYQTPDGQLHNLFADVPVYQNPTNAKLPMIVRSQSSDADMVFEATVEITAPCPTCVVILKQTYHPNWHVEVNGKTVPAIDVFPSFVAVPLEQPGVYTIKFSYTSPWMKTALLFGGIVFFLIILFLGIPKKR